LRVHNKILCAATGPVNIHERVMRAMTRPAQNHRDPWFAPWFSSILEEVKTIFKTKEGTTFIFPGTGTGAEPVLAYLATGHARHHWLSKHASAAASVPHTATETAVTAQAAGSRP
jgi:hypothetical protein